MQHKLSHKRWNSYRGVNTDLHHVHSQEQRKATGQSHWTKLRMAHRTATKFKPPYNADTAKKVSPTGIQSLDLPYLYQQISVSTDSTFLPLPVGLQCIARNFLASCIFIESAFCGCSLLQTRFCCTCTAGSHASLNMQATPRPEIPSIDGDDLAAKLHKAGS